MLAHKYIFKTSYNVFQAFLFSFLLPPAKRKAMAYDLRDLRGLE